MKIPLVLMACGGLGIHEPCPCLNLIEILKFKVAVLALLINEIQFFGLWAVHMLTLTHSLDVCCWDGCVYWEKSEKEPAQAL